MFANVKTIVCVSEINLKRIRSYKYGEAKAAGYWIFEKYLSVWVISCMVIGVFIGPQSPAALATIVGVLTEVPVMLILVKIANNTTHWFPTKNANQLDK